VVRPQYPEAHPAVATAVFDGEAVLFDERSMMSHRLNAIVAAVWVLCDGATDEAAMLDELAELFPLSHDELAQHVGASIDLLQQSHLLVGSGDPDAPPVVADVVPRPPDA
jgi:hypothetical protein